MPQFVVFDPLLKEAGNYFWLKRTTMQNLKEQLEQTKQALIKTISSIDKRKTDIIPFEGSWTAGQVLEHISKSINPGILSGTAKEPGRPADEQVHLIKSIFLDFDKKFVAPDFITPAAPVHDTDALLEKITGKFDKLIAAADTMNLSEECLGFVVPGFGHFTRLEWIVFYMVHTQRHIQQLRNIAEKL